MRRDTPLRDRQTAPLAGTSVPIRNCVRSERALWTQALRTLDS